MNLTLEPGADSPSPGGPEQVDGRVLDRIAALSPDTGRQIVRSVVQAYLESSPAYVQELMSGLDHGDLERVRNAAHSLKSSAASIGALNFATICQLAETAAREADQTTVIAKSAVIGQAHPFVCDSLRRELDRFS